MILHINTGSRCQVLICENSRPSKSLVLKEKATNSKSAKLCPFIPLKGQDLRLRSTSVASKTPWIMTISTNCVVMNWRMSNSPKDTPANPRKRNPPSHPYSLHRAIQTMHSLISFAAWSWGSFNAQEFFFLCLPIRSSFFLHTRMTKSSRDRRDTPYTSDRLLDMIFAFFTMLKFANDLSNG